MDYNDLIAGMKRFGAADEDICVNSLGIASNMIQDTVVITPGWEPQKVSGLGKAELLISSAPLYGSKVWNIKNGDIEMTFIKTGCGAPALMDTLLPLVAIFCASDNTIANKSLISGRTQDEEAYRKFVRGEVLPNIILSLINSDISNTIAKSSK